MPSSGSSQPPTSSDTTGSGAISPIPRTRSRVRPALLIAPPRTRHPGTLAHRPPTPQPAPPRPPGLAHPPRAHPQPGNFPHSPQHPRAHAAPVRLFVAPPPMPPASHAEVQRDFPAARVEDEVAAGVLLEIDRQRLG